MAKIATHFEGLSESISIDDGVGARDKWRRECKFPLKDPAILRLRLILGGLLLDTMIGQIRAVRVCSSHDNLQFYFSIDLSKYNLDSTVKAPLTSAMKGPVP